MFQRTGVADKGCAGLQAAVGQSQHKVVPEGVPQWSTRAYCGYCRVLVWCECGLYEKSVPCEAAVDGKHHRWANP